MRPPIADEGSAGGPNEVKGVWRAHKGAPVCGSHRSRPPFHFAGNPGNPKSRARHRFVMVARHRPAAQLIYFVRTTHRH
jgi:hypothetical protein